MSEMITYTSRVFDPADMTVDHIDINDIAHHLSMLCRWGGAVKRFYSVAQHSVRVCRLLHPMNRQVQLWGLLHDASEAYLGDVIRPIKGYLAERYGPMEDKVMALICSHYNLPLDCPKEVDMADTQAWREEKENLIDNNILSYSCLTPEQAEKQFINLALSFREDNQWQS